MQLFPQALPRSQIRQHSAAGIQMRRARASLPMAHTIAMATAATALMPAVCRSGSRALQKKIRSRPQPARGRNRYLDVTFVAALSFLAGAEEDLPEVVHAVLGMATFAGLLGNTDARDQAIEIASALLLSCPTAGLPV